MNLTQMIVAVFMRLVDSYKTFIVQPTKNWFFPFRISLAVAAIFIYALTSLVVFTVLLIVVFISLPISLLSKI